MYTLYKWLDYEVNFTINKVKIDNGAQLSQC